jgi:hypothetical protein
MVLVWLACSDEKTCTDCQSKDGKIVSEEPVEKPLEGGEWLSPEQYDELYESDKEIAYVYDKDGNLVGRYEGTVNKVTIPKGALTPGGRIVHNHPETGNSSATFSNTDVFTAIKRNVRESKVVSQQLGIEYTMKPDPIKGWPKEDEFKNEFTKGMNEIYTTYREELTKIDKDQAYANLRSNYNSMFKRVCGKTGILYEERSIK